MIPVLVCVAASLLFLYPYVIYPWTLERLRAAPEAGINKQNAASTGENFAILFCAFNEENSLHQKIANLRDLKRRYSGLEILAYDDSSTDKTASILAGASDIITLVRGAGRAGKGAGMRELVKRTNASFLILCDANVLLDLEVVAALEEHYLDSNVGGVCGTLKYSATADSPTAVVGGGYWSLEERIKELESRTGNVMGADGSLFSVRRGLYPVVPSGAQDDFFVSMHVIFAGFRLKRGADVIAYENLVTRRGEEMTRKTRIAARAIFTHKAMVHNLRRMSGRDKFKYASHKLVRWFGGVPLIVAILAGLWIIAEISALLISATLLSTVAVLIMGTRGIGLAGRLVEMLTAILATLHGALLGARGRTFVTWNPPESR